MNKDKFIIGGVLVAIVLATIAFFNTGQKTIVEKIIEKSTGVQLGGVSNLDILNVGPNGLSQSSTTQTTSGFDNNGLFEYATTGTCNDATSTVFAIQNPFRATSTAIYASFDVNTPATTTVVFSVATSTSSGADNPPIGPHLIAFNSVRFGRKGHIYSGSHASSSIVINSSNATNTPVTAIDLGPWDYLIGFVSGTSSGATSFNYNGGVLGGNNTFACTYSVKFIR